MPRIKRYRTTRIRNSKSAWKDGFEAGKKGQPYGSNPYDLKRHRANPKGVVVPVTYNQDERPVKPLYIDVAYYLGSDLRDYVASKMKWYSVSEEDWTIGWLEGSGRIGTVTITSNASLKVTVLC